MAGSRRWFEYTADDATAYAIEMDESNGTAAGNTPLAAFANPLPKRLKPRTAHYEWVNAGTAGQGTGITRRRIVYGDRTAFDALVLGDTLSLPEYQAVAGVGQVTPNVMRDFVLVAKDPEKLSRGPRLADTNMDQG